MPGLPGESTAGITVWSIDIEMQPVGTIGTRQGRPCLLQHSYRAHFPGREDIDARDLGRVDVGPGKVGIAAVALADLHHRRLRDERTGNARPFGEQRLATPGGQGQIHAGGGTERGIGIVVAGMAEVAVAVDMHQRDGTQSPRSRQCAEQHRAIAADDQRPFASPDRLGDNIRQFEIEAADRMPVAQPGAGLRFGAIDRPLEIDDGDWRQGFDQAGLGQSLWSAPGAGHMARPQGSQTEIGRRTNKANVAHAAESGSTLSPA